MVRWFVGLLAGWWLVAELGILVSSHKIFNRMSLKFWNPAGLMACALTLLLPSATVFSLYHHIRDSLDMMVLQVTKPQQDGVKSMNIIIYI